MNLKTERFWADLLIGLGRKRFVQMPRVLEGAFKVAVFLCCLGMIVILALLCCVLLLALLFGVAEGALSYGLWECISLNIFIHSTSFAAFIFGVACRAAFLRFQGWLVRQLAAAIGFGMERAIGIRADRGLLGAIISSDLPEGEKRRFLELAFWLYRHASLPGTHVDELCAVFERASKLSDGGGWTVLEERVGMLQALSGYAVRTLVRVDRGNGGFEGSPLLEPSAAVPAKRGAA